MNQEILRRHVAWFQKNEPFLFEIAKNINALQNKGMGNWSSLFTSIADTVKNVAPGLTQLYTQKKILDTQLARAKSGLPPLETSQYAPTVKIEAGMTPEAEESAKRIAVDVVRQGIGDMKPLFFGALALGAFLLLRRK